MNFKVGDKVSLCMTDGTDKGKPFHDRKHGRVYQIDSFGPLIFVEWEDGTSYSYNPYILTLTTNGLDRVLDEI